VQEKLQAVPNRFAFQHGPRIFGIPGRKGVAPITPAQRALQALDLSNTRGYLTLINTETDVLGDFSSQPIPGLVGLQFLRNDNKLDLVATFRSIELSFWWVVNMYEAVRILEWGAQRKNMDPGTISFFSPLAEWRDDPRASFPTRVDEVPVNRLANLVLTRSAAEIHELIEMLEEKIRHTSIFDLDASGLHTLAGLLRMRALSEPGVLLSDIAEPTAVALTKAALEIDNAMRNPKERDSRVKVATSALREAIVALTSRANS
jgi:hypothetical protein